MSKRSLLLLILLVVASFDQASRADEATIPAPSPNHSFLYGNFYYHSESRLDVNDVSRISARNVEFSIGFDYLLNPKSELYVGGRTGVYREQVLTSVPVGPAQSRPFVGGQIYRLFPFERHFAFKLGAALDLLIVPNGPSAPVWLYAGALSGFRVKLSDALYIESPIELGVTPFFDGGPPLFFKFGLQVGFAL